ncbi:MAG: XkdX family protein [Oscillospiraceae bacterium]|nr:XkdX family protein [Oscillospiraceae bacterium]
MYNKIKKWYEQGLWTAEMVQQAADKGVITQEQANEILSEKAAE